MEKSNRFRKALEVGVFAGGVLASQAPAAAFESEKKTPPDIPALVTFVRHEHNGSTNMKLHFPERASDSERSQKIVAVLKSFDSEVMSLYGMRRSAKSDTTLYARKEQVSRIPSPDEQRALWQKTWTALSAVVPDMPKAYSDKAFFDTFVNDIPHTLAPSRMVLYHNIITYGERNVPEAFEVRSNIYPIEEKTSFHGDVFGKTVDADVLQLGKPLHESVPLVGELANYRYGAIVLTPNAGERTNEVWSRAKDDIEGMFGGMSGEPNSLPPDSAVRNDLVCMLALKDVFSRSVPSPAEWEQAHLAHEVGHVVDGNDAAYQQAFADQSLHKEGDELVKAHLNESAHGELGAILSSLRYASNRQLPLFELFNFLISNRDMMSFAHHRASQWIRSGIIEEIGKNPESYGISLRKNSVFNESEQILLELPRISQEHPDTLAPVWEQLWHRHRTQFSQDFLASVPELPAHVPGSQSSDYSFLALLGAGIGTAGAAAAIHAWFKRKKE